MPYGLRGAGQSLQERGCLLGEWPPSEFSDSLPEALRLQQEVEKALWLSQAFTLRNRDVSSEAVARWGLSPTRERVSQTPY